ncbi:MAG TPA: DUF1573 domain-containing protein [Planctomycetes bacterium]|nr:DUF1573 domain-containing protein [Fuerstiella sp.]HIK90366.1 DUF1573 domain-containing protein [Planctomycetota bacterium]
MKSLLIAVFSFGPGILLISGCAEETASGPQGTANHDHSDGANADHQDSEAPVPSEQGPWPSAVAEATEFDFGRMPIGGELEHAFVIRNEGDADLHLVAGEPTCKCTAFELSTTTIKPGEEGRLLVRWVGKLKDDSFQHGGPVYTDDPKNKELRFDVTGIVDMEFNLFPQGVWMIANASTESGGTMQAVIASHVHQEFEITAIDCESPYISTVVMPATQKTLAEYDAICAYTIDVTVSPDMPPGIMEESLVLKLDRIEEPYVVKVRAKKAGPIQILPTPGVTFDSTVNGLKLGQFPTHKGRQAELTLLVDTSEMSKPFAATSIETSPKFVTAELGPETKLGGQRSRYKLVIRIPPGIPRMERGRSSPGLIDIQTNHPSGQAIKLMVSFKTF